MDAPQEITVKENVIKLSHELLVSRLRDIKRREPRRKLLDLLSASGDSVMNEVMTLYKRQTSLARNIREDFSLAPESLLLYRQYNKMQIATYKTYADSYIKKLSWLMAAAGLALVGGPFIPDFLQVVITGILFFALIPTALFILFKTVELSKINRECRDIEMAIGLVAGDEDLE